MKKQTKMQSDLLILLIVVVTALAGCETSDSSGSVGATATGSSVRSAVPQIVAVSYPLEYLTQRISGAAFEVHCPVPVGVSASRWRPQRDDILKMQAADLIVANGVGAKYAKWIDIVSLPDSKVCNSATRGLALADYIAVEDVRLVHSHGPEGEHSHATMVPYTWLDPAIAAKQADYIAVEMARIFPNHADEIQKNLAVLKQELNALSLEMKSLRDSSEASPTIVFTANPDLKFLTRGIGWTDVHLNWFEPPTSVVAVEPLIMRISQAESNQTFRKAGETVLLSTYPMPTELQDALKSKHVTVLVIDTLDSRPDSGDYLSVMKSNIAKLK